MSANEYYDSTGAPKTRSEFSSSTIRDEFDDIESGFNKMPVLAGHGSNLVAVNAAGTALETIDPDALFASPPAIGTVSPSSGAFTTVAVGTTVTVGTATLVVNGSDNLTFTDAVTGTKTLAELITGGTGIVWSLITADPGPAVRGIGYLCDTTGGAFTVTLPAAPSVGDVVEFADAAGMFDTLNLTIGRNGLKIMGLNENMTVSTKYAAFKLVYASALLGWRIA
jgi:hypothetical protein